MKRKFYLIIASFLLLVIVIGIVGLYHYQQNGDSPAEINNITFYELQTHEYFSDAPDETQYHIDSTEELNKFYSIYSNSLEIDAEQLKNNDIFIKVASASSGSIKNKLKNVTFNNNALNFEIETDIPEIGTQDMAFWYFVAVIPKEKLKDISLSDWVKPSTITIKE